MINSVGLAHVRRIDELSTILNQCLIKFNEGFRRLGQAHAKVKQALHQMATTANSVGTRPFETVAQVKVWCARVLAMYRKELVFKCVAIEGILCGGGAALTNSRQPSAKGQVIGGLNGEGSWGKVQQDVEVFVPPLTELQSEVHVAALMMEPYLDTDTANELLTMIRAYTEATST